MKAILLAAGKGERIKDITKFIPKPMIRVDGKPILERNIVWLRKYGIKDIYINLHHLPDIIQNYFGNGSKFGVRITYSCELNLLGTAGAVRKIADEYWEEDDEPFLVIYGDNLMDYNLHDIIKFHKKKNGIATIAVYEKEDVSQSGIVVMDKNNKVLHFIEKPKHEEIVSHLVNTGIYILGQDVLEYIPFGKMKDFGKEVFPEMIRNSENIYGVIVDGNLKAFDTPDLLEARGIK